MPKIRLHPIAAGLHAMRWPLTAAGLLAPAFAVAGPSGGQVVAGQASINTPNAGTVVVNQGSHSAAINWQQFSVGSNEYVVFNQPSASATVLNRVVGGMPSEILGNISSNGRVFLVNPNGIAFGQGAKVDVGGLVASTLDIANEDFLKGRYVFAGAQNGNGKISNAGTLTARDGGFVVLAGQQVSNTGLIQAQLGDVVLGSGSAVTLDINGSGLVNFVVDRAAVSNAAGVENLGEITANGGTVIMAANVARSLISNAVNNTGRISAGSIEEHDGQIFLSATGGNIAQNGTLDVSGSGGADGGTIRVHSDKDIVLGDQARILARGADGGEVRLIAERKLDTAAGSLIDGRASTSSGKGGFVELSGHQAFRTLGKINLGRDGTVLIDPNTIEIVANSNSSCYGDACIGTDNIEGLLNGGTNVYIIAADSITIRSFGTDNTLNAYGGGDLFFGIGSPASGSIPNNDGYGGNPFSRGSAQSAYGGFIKTESSDLKIAIQGAVEFVGAEDRGDISIGEVSGSRITITSSGTVTTGKLTANRGGVVIDAQGKSGSFYGIQVSDDISARGLIDLSSGIGGISVRNLTLEQAFNDDFDGSASVSLKAAGPVVVDGLLSAISDYGGVSVDIQSTDDKIELRGANRNGVLTSLIAQSRYDNDAPESTGTSNAIVTLTAHGDIQVGGAVTVSAEAVPTSYDTPVFDGEGTQTGNVHVTTRQAFAVLTAQTCASNCDDSSEELPGSEGNINFDGAVNVSAEGTALVVVSTEGSIALNDTLTVGATAGVTEYSRSVSDTQETFLVKDGQATVILTAGDEIVGNEEFEGVSTNGVTITGPNASLLMQGGQLRLRNQGSGIALKVAADVASEFSHRFGSADSDLVSNYGEASVSLIGANAGNRPTIGIDGSVSVVGPVARMHVGSAGDVLLENGNLMVKGTGYRVAGDDWSLFDANLFGFPDTGGDLAVAVAVDAPLPGIFSRFSAESDDAIPNSRLTRLTQGEVQAGRGELTIFGYSEISSADFSDAPLAGNVQILGDIDVSGVGAANVSIFSTGFEAGNIDIGATTGLIQGTGQTTLQLGEGVTATYAYAFSDGNGGSARYSQASFSLLGDGNATQVSFDDLTVTGGGAVAVLDNIGRLEAQNITIAGGTGGNASSYVESLSITHSNDSTQNFNTEVTGDISLFDVGFADEEGETVPDVVQISGALKVSGTGVAGAVVRGGSVSIGSVEVASDLGVYRTDNPEYTSDLGNFGDAIAWIEATGDSPATVGGNLKVEADGDVHLGVRADVDGSASIKAGLASTDGAIDQTLSSALLGYEHPAGSQSGLGEDSQSAVTLANTRLDASSIALQFTGERSALESSVLKAGGSLSVSGGGGSVNGTLDAGEGLDWSGNVITTSNVRLVSSGQAKLTAVDDIRLNAGTTIDTRTAVLDAGDVAQSTGNVVFDVGGVSIRARQISMASSDFTVGNAAVSLGSDPALLSGLPASLRPLSSGPNAAFQAADGVALGDLVMDGDYLFVRTNNFNPASVSRGRSDKAAGDSLFMNVRRFGNNQTLDVSAITLDPRFAELQTTYVYGGSNYSGDLVTQKTIDLGATNSNMVLLTSGKIIGKNLISPNGSVLVLKGTEPPPEIPPPETIPETNTAQRTSTELNSLAEQFATQPSYIELAGADLIDEDGNSQTEELECK